MAEGLISKQKAEALMRTKGKIRGVALEIDAEFIIKEEGEKGLQKIEGALAELGYPFQYEEVKPLGFYPLGLRFITLLLLRGLFDFSDQKFVEMGEFGIKTSLLIRLSLKSFVSLSMAARQLPKIWKMYFTRGDLQVAELDEEDKRVVLQIKNFPVDSVHARYLMGYFQAGIQMITREKAVCKITKATFKGDDYTEFVLGW